MRKLDQVDSEFLSTKFLTSDSHREKLGLLKGLNNLKSLLAEELGARGNTCLNLNKIPFFSESSSLI